jgi:CheY-like chemotaxis protein
MGKKILLADDSITIQKVIELTFSDEDFEVVTVGNGRLAVEKVQDVRPDLVLCDIIMPEKDGYEVCDFIKKTPSLAHIPVLLLTGAFEPFDQDRANRVGCDGFLAKPFEPQTLIAKVKDLLSQAGTRTVAPTRTAAVPPPPATPPAPPASASPMASASAYPPPAARPDATGHSDDFQAGEPSFITDEPLETPTMITPSYTEIGKSVVYEEPPMPPPAPATAAPEELSYVDDLPEADELMDVSAEESATLQGDVAEDTMNDTPSPWAQPTVEVPLEMRAQASVESASPSDATFDEVFEEEPAAAHLGSGSEDFGEMRTQDVIGSPAVPSVPSAAARHDAGSLPGVSAHEPEKRAPEPREVAPPAVESSFAAVAPTSAPESPAVSSLAAEVGVPVDMVEKIAQRVVAQISEKVIREIAWEVIPDLAENLIKKEIDKLKAELQQT